MTTTATSTATPRRILLLNERDSGHPRAGGAELHVERIFSRLAARGHEVVQYSTGFSGAAPREQIDGISIERRGPLPFFYASVPARVRRAARLEAFDLVIECLNKVPFYAPLYSPIPVLALCHHLFGHTAFDQVSWPIAAAVVLSESGLARAYRDCAFLAISESTRDDLLQRGIPAEHIRVSHPGIDPPTFDVDPLSARPCRATYVGRLERYKRVDLLLRAGALLVDRFPDLELLVIGKGPERDSLERLTDQLGLRGRTRFTGFIEDAERDALLAGTRVCLFPSEKEGWGLTVIESNALGTPVVARNAPGLRDSIRHNVTGILIDAKGAEEAAGYADAMATLLEEDDRALSIRQASLEWSSHFDWDHATNQMEAAIEHCLAGGHA